MDIHQMKAASIARGKVYEAMAKAIADHWSGANDHRDGHWYDHSTTTALAEWAEAVAHPHVAKVEPGVPTPALRRHLEEWADLAERTCISDGAPGNTDDKPADDNCYVDSAGNGVWVETRVQHQHALGVCAAILRELLVRDVSTQREDARMMRVMLAG